MTLSEIEQTIALFTAAGRRNIPVPISEWREAMIEKGKMPKRIKSDFALLDVTAGRQALANMMPPGSKSLPEGERIPVTIRGFISHRHGADDGTSIEFGVDVTEVEIMPTKSIGKVDQKALAKGKIKPVDKAPVNVKRGRKPKADRQEAGLRANRARKAKA